MEHINLSGKLCRSKGYSAISDAYPIGSNRYKTKPILDFSRTANYTFELFTYQTQQVNHAFKGS